jgi:hypothetical protein
MPTAWLAKISPLQDLFTKLIQDQKRKDEDDIIASDVSQNGVLGFKDSFVREFSKNAALRNIIGLFGALQDDSKAHPGPVGALKWGLNTLDDKAAYLEGAESLYHDWAENYARRLASSESLFLFDEIVKGLPTCQCPGADAVEGKLLAAMKNLDDTGTRPSLILIALQVPHLMELEKSDKFEPRWRLRSHWKDMLGFHGVFRFGRSEVPIFEVWTGDNRNVLCVMDPSKCLQLTQKSPLDDGKDH